MRTSGSGNAQMPLLRTPGTVSMSSLKRFAEFLQLAIAGIGTDERHLHDVDEARAGLAHFEARDVRRQAGPDAVHLAHDLVVFLFGILVPVELDLDHADAVERTAVHALDVVEFVERVLDRIDDQPFDVGRIGARVRDDHGRDRRVKLRVLRRAVCSAACCSRRAINRPNSSSVNCQRLTAKAQMRTGVSRDRQRRRARPGRPSATLRRR